jgi:uncharacterized protein (DUF4213/DUF364 family)
MALLENLIDSVPAGVSRLEEAVFGPLYAMVVSSHCGLAAVPEGAGGMKTFQPDGLAGRPLADLLRLAVSGDPASVSLGIAALNAVLLESPETAHFQPYGIPRAGGKKVGLVGRFAFAEHLKTLAREVVEVDRDDASRVLPGVDIAVISGSYIVDHSLESLLEAARSCYTIVFGPSTPLSSVLFEYGADQLVGVRVEDATATAEWVRTGMADLMACPGLRSVVLRKGRAA